MLIKHNDGTMWTVSLLPDEGIVRKVWTSPLHDKAWLQHHIGILEKVAPDYVVSFGVTEAGIYIEYKFIEGTTLSEWSKSRYQTNLNEVQEKWYEAARFWVDGIKETHPYAHWDWTSGNTIVCDDGSLKMIDWDQCCIATHSDLRDRFAYRVERERTGVLAACLDVNAEFDKIKLDVMSYFDKTLGS
jgi:hypothetical protein